jgi:hypothetical protein
MNIGKNKKTVDIDTLSFIEQMHEYVIANPTVKNMISFVLYNIDYDKAMTAKQIQLEIDKTIGIDHIPSVVTIRSILYEMHRKGEIGRYKIYANHGCKKVNMHFDIGHLNAYLRARMEGDAPSPGLPTYHRRSKYTQIQIPKKLKKIIKNEAEKRDVPMYRVIEYALSCMD